jgi:ribosomal-protein-alanine N-acetyltransferase
MQDNDIDQIMVIEKLVFSFPWSRKSFEAELKKDFGISLVAVFDNQVVGYLIGWFIADEIHIANVAVHPVWRRRGIAEKLIREVIENIEGFYWIGLEVRRSNLAARALYKKLGFREVGVRRNYYVNEGEDAILMSIQL